MVSLMGSEDFLKKLTLIRSGRSSSATVLISVAIRPSSI